MEIGTIYFLSDKQMNSTSARITRPYADLSGCIRAITSYCDLLVVYQHDTETQTVSEGGKTHIHFVMTHKQTVKNLKNIIQKALPCGDALSGNEDWKFAKWDGDMKALTYMTKGKLEPKYFQGIESTELIKFRQQWVAPTVKSKDIPEEFKIYLRLIDDAHKIRHPLYAVSEMSDDICEKDMSRVYTRFNHVRKYFFNELRKTMMLMSPTFFRRLKTYTLTYCMDNEIAIPRQRDAWENYEN